MTSTLKDTATIDKLIFLHEENIRRYKKVLVGSLHIEGDMKTIFERILEESMRCRNELIPAGEDKEITDNQFALREADTTGDRKTILSNCLNNVLAVLNFYPLLLLTDIKDSRLRTILDAQHESVKQLYMHIKQFHDAQ